MSVPEILRRARKTLGLDIDEAIDAARKKQWQSSLLPPSLVGQNPVGYWSALGPPISSTIETSTNGGVSRLATATDDAVRFIEDSSGAGNHMYRNTNAGSNDTLLDFQASGSFLIPCLNVPRLDPPNDADTTAMRVALTTTGGINAASLMGDQWSITWTGFVFNHKVGASPRPMLLSWQTIYKYLYVQGSQTEEYPPQHQGASAIPVFWGASADLSYRLTTATTASPVNMSNRMLGANGAPLDDYGTYTDLTSIGAAAGCHAGTPAVVHYALTFDLKDDRRLKFYINGKLATYRDDDGPTTMREYNKSLTANPRAYSGTDEKRISLGGTATNSLYNLGTAGRIISSGAFAKVLTPAQIAQLAYEELSIIPGSRGRADTQIFVIGNSNVHNVTYSTTIDYGGISTIVDEQRRFGPQLQRKLGKDVPVFCYGFNGATPPSWSTSEPEPVIQHGFLQGQASIAVLVEWTNGLGQGTTVEVELAAMRAAVAKVRAQGATYVVVPSPISKTPGVASYQTKAAAVASRLIASGGGVVGADATVDFWSDPRIGGTTAYSNTTYFNSDGVHLTAEGVNVATTLLANALIRLRAQWGI